MDTSGARGFLVILRMALWSAAWGLVGNTFGLAIIQESYAMYTKTDKKICA